VRRAEQAERQQGPLGRVPINSMTIDWYYDLDMHRYAKRLYGVTTGIRLSQDNMPAGSKIRKIMRLAGDGSFGFEVVGESHHQHALRAIAGDPDPRGHHHLCEAILRSQPDNPYDSHAVEVLVGAAQIGFIPRYMAGELFALLQGRNLTEVYCPAIIVGGWDRGHGDVGYYGIRLDIVRPFRLAVSRGPVAERTGPLPSKMSLSIRFTRVVFAILLGFVMVLIIGFGFASCR